MKPILIFLTVFLFALNASYAIIDPTKTINKLETEISEKEQTETWIGQALVNANLTAEERKDLEKWKKEVQDEKKELDRRLDLLLKVINTPGVMFFNSK